jgi:hypothetical protein
MLTDVKTKVTGAEPVFSTQCGPSGWSRERSTAFARDAAVDIEGIRTVLALRSQYGQPHRELADPGKYYDLSYYDRAQPQ